MRYSSAWTILLAISAAFVSSDAAGAEISRWRFDGDALDSVGNRDGTLLGDAAFSNDVPPGQTGTSLALDGTLDKVIFDVQSADMVSGQFTVAAWVKIASPRPQGTLTWFGTRFPDDNGFDIKARGDESSLIRVDLGNGSSFPLISNSPAALTIGAWHHVAVTVASNRLDLYVDGTRIHNEGISDFTTLLWDVNHDIAIGGVSASLVPNGPPNGEDFAGWIDDVRVFDAALSQAEVKELAVPEPRGATLSLAAILAIVFVSFRRTTALKSGRSSFVVNETTR